MKYINQLTSRITVIIMISLISFSSCKKEKIITPPVASLTTVNAVAGGTSLKVGSMVRSVANNSSAQLSLLAGETNLYVWPVGDSLHPYYVSPAKFNPQDREVYSLFVFGAVGSTDGIVVKENIPYRTDSTAGIRFINLAPNTGTKPINITIAATPTVNDLNNLSYKSYTDFRSYPALVNSSYTFQIRNDTCAAPKAPLATFSFSSSSLPRFTNVTMVIRQNGTGLAMFRVNNDR